MAGSVLPLVPLVGCATPQYVAGPTQLLEPPRVRVGERWRYESINRYNNTPTAGQVATVREAGPGGLKVGVTTLAGQPVGEEWYADPWRVLQDLNYDMPQLYAAPMPIIPSRLEAGAAESASTTFQVPGASGRFYWSQWLKAPGWERIRVPAGEFLCLRVQRIIQFRHSDIFRERPERIDTIWYAPEVNRWVQREWTGYYYSAGGSMGPVSGRLGHPPVAGSHDGA